MRTIFALLFLAACSKPVQKTDHSPVAPPPVVASQPATRTFVAAAYGMTGGKLDTCVEVSVEVDVPKDVATGWPKKNPAEVLLPKEGTKLPGTCKEQFGDRVALASCELDPKPYAADGGSLTVGRRSVHYLFETVGTSDEEMNTCNAAGGRWTSIPRTSREWKRAAIEHERSKLERLSKKIVDEENEGP